MKVLEILAFVREPKSSRQITERFGKHWNSNMANLVRKGCVEKFDMVNEDSNGRYQRFIVTGWKATGVEYKTYDGDSPRREYHQKYYHQVRKAKKNATKTPQP